VHEGRAKTIMIGTHKDYIAAAADIAVEDIVMECALFQNSSL